MAYVEIEDDVYDMLKDTVFIEKLVFALRCSGYCIERMPENCDKTNCCKEQDNG